MSTTTTRRSGALLGLLVLLFFLAPAAALAQAKLGPGLEATLAGLAPDEQITVLVTFAQDEPLTDAQVASIEALGITQGVRMDGLPIAGVLATAAQVNALAAMEGVLSVWPNLQLTYYNDGSRQITGVERARTDATFQAHNGGLPISGRGVTVVVNDTGIDGLHPDLEYGSHVVENAQGLTNLNAYSGILPITYTEGQPNTDTNSGHGTHVAGTVGGSGAMSSGLYEGVAPGADLVGYGSGAVLFILDAVGGLNYALTHQFAFENPVRVVTNSWGTSGTFDPADPVNVASYQLYKRGITVTFAAGNSGPGEDSHNPYAVAPWVISVGAGDKDGQLAKFSSRGMEGDTYTFTMPDGRTWTYVNQPTIVAPGVEVVSARATTDVIGFTLSPPPDLAHWVHYTELDGTSMATPHVAGIVALLLEADPSLSPDEVKAVLQQTATNMPSYEAWEVGAGYVNAYAAVAHAMGLRTDYGTTRNDTRAFDSHAIIIPAGEQPFTVAYDPITEFEEHTFEVPAGTALIKARAEVMSALGEALNTVALVLYGPDGTVAGSGLTLPLLGSNVARVSVDNPAPGTWRLTFRGIGYVAGFPMDPLAVTNGYALPEEVSGTLSFFNAGGYVGLDDVAGHPAEAAIKVGVSERYVDGFSDGTYKPDNKLTREQLADFLVMGAGVRQSLPLDGTATFSDVSTTMLPFVEAVAAAGAALRDREHLQDALVLPASDGRFKPKSAVSRAELAYSLVQALGLEWWAQGFTGTVTAPYDDQDIAVEDAGSIPAGLAGYVHIALNLGLMNAYFALEQGPYDLVPTLKAYFEPDQAVTRGEYAVTILRYADAYTTPSVDFEEAAEGTEGDGAAAELRAGTLPAADAALPETFALEQNYPNPFNPTTTITYAVPVASQVRVTVYNLLGQEVRVLVDAPREAGTYRVSWDGRDAAGVPVASGTYLYRMDAGAHQQTRTMVMLK